MKLLLSSWLIMCLSVVNNCCGNSTKKENLKMNLDADVRCNYANRRHSHNDGSRHSNKCHSEDEHYTERESNTKNEVDKVVCVAGQHLVIDADYIETMQEVMQMWWTQRGQLWNVKFEISEIERESGVRTQKLDSIINKTEELIEQECKIVWNILWGDRKEYRHPLNKTSIDGLLLLWKELETRFEEYHVEGADVEVKNFRYELKYAQDDLPRQYKALQKLIEESTKKKKLKSTNVEEEAEGDFFD